MVSGKNILGKIDVVIHFFIADIVPSMNNPTKYFNVNVKGTLNILENCREFKVKKIIYCIIMLFRDSKKISNR